MAAQDIINGLDFARRAQEVHGTIAVSQFSRLHDVIASNEGALTWRLFGNVEDGKPRLHLKVHGELVLMCQRCLGPMRYEVDIDTLYYLVTDESAIPPEEEDLDDREYLVAEPQMQVAGLIEDEVLLSLPLAPKHAECKPSVEVADEGKPNPFAVLQALKAGRDRTN